MLSVCCCGERSLAKSPKCIGVMLSNPVPCNQHPMSPILAVHIGADCSTSGFMHRYALNRGAFLKGCVLLVG
jgi:hypothetical protein